MRAPSSPVLRTRPCPTFGRPVRLGFPHRLRPGTSPHALRIPPHGGHPSLRSTASSGSRSALASIQLSPSCPFRRLHTFCFLRPARNYPRFWIWRPSFERQRDFNPPEQRAAQRAVPQCLVSPFGRSRPAADATHDERSSPRSVRSRRRGAGWHLATSNRVDVRG